MAEPFYSFFRAAAGEGALYELKMRLLADLVPELASLALGGKLYEIEKQVVIVFKHCLSDAEVADLEHCRQLRNKLLHGDFFEARRKLGELGASPKNGGVVHVTFGDRLTVETVERVQAGKLGVPVASMTSTAEAGILGWFFELGASGDLEEAERVFRRMSALVDRLAVEAQKLPSVARKR